MGATLTFFVALFTEMYGFPLTIYILTGILGSKYPALNPFSHSSGHLWLTFFGGGTAMMTVIHLISNGLVLIGFMIMWKGWSLIHSSKGGFVTDGPYAYVRHPQYSGLFLVMISIADSMADDYNRPDVPRAYIRIPPLVKEGGR
jgi:methanethiol S-methyltransferase